MAAIVAFVLNILRKPDFTILDSEKIRVDNQDFTVHRFVYNGNRYKYVGDPFSPTIQRGFFVPISTATWNGRDVTKTVKEFGGPRHNFFGHEPPVKIMFCKCFFFWTKFCKFTENGLRIGFKFKKSKLAEPEQGVLVIQNVLGQTSVFGAK